MYVFGTAKGRPRGIDGGQRQSDGRSRQRTAASRGRLVRLHSGDGGRVAKPPSRLGPGSGRPPPTNGVTSLSQEMDKEASEAIVTDIGSKMNDSNDNSDEDEYDDVSEPAQGQQQQRHGPMTPAADEGQTTQKQNNDLVIQKPKQPVS